MADFFVFVFIGVRGWYCNLHEMSCGQKKEKKKVTNVQRYAVMHILQLLESAISMGASGEKTW